MAQGLESPPSQIPGVAELISRANRIYAAAIGGLVLVMKDSQKTQSFFEDPDNVSGEGLKRHIAKVFSMNDQVIEVVSLGSAWNRSWADRIQIPTAVLNHIREAPLLEAETIEAAPWISYEWNPPLIFRIKVLPNDKLKVIRDPDSKWDSFICTVIYNGLCFLAFADTSDLGDFNPCDLGPEVREALQGVFDSSEMVESAQSLPVPCIVTFTFLSMTLSPQKEQAR